MCVTSQIMWLHTQTLAKCDFTHEIAEGCVTSHTKLLLGSSNKIMEDVKSHRACFCEVTQHYVNCEFTQHFHVWVHRCVKSRDMFSGPYLNARKMGIFSCSLSTKSVSPKDLCDFTEIDPFFSKSLRHFPQVQSCVTSQIFNRPVNLVCIWVTNSYNVDARKVKTFSQRSKICEVFRLTFNHSQKHTSRNSLG